MGVFGAVFGRRGDGGFSGPLLGVCSGVVGFNIAMFLSPVREICRPARPGVGESAKKFAQRAQNAPYSAFLRLLGEFFREGAAERSALGDLFRGSAAGPHGVRVVRPQSLWARLVSGEKFRMQFPSRHFKS